MVAELIQLPGEDAEIASPLGAGAGGGSMQAAAAGGDVSTTAGVLRALLGQGVALGFGDEIEAFIQSRLNNTDFQAELQDVRQQLRAFREQEPALAIGSEIAGSLLTPAGVGLGAARAGAGLLRTAATGAGAGAVGGAATGFGTAEGGLGNRLEGAVLGGATGGVLGGAAAPVVQGLARAGQIAARQLRPGGVGDQAIETVAEGFQRDRIPVEEVAGALGLQGGQIAQVGGSAAGRAAQQAELTIADAVQLLGEGSGASVLRTGRAAASIQGPGAARAAEFLEGRQAAQGRELVRFIDDNLGTAMFQSRSDQIRDVLTRQANDAYTSLHARADVPVDASLARFFENPRVRRLYRRAAQDAFDETGEALPPFNQVLQATQIPVRALDWMQRRMRRETDAAFRTGDASASAKRRLRERFLDLVDPRVPGFEQVRRAFADGRAAEEALDAGQRFAQRVGVAQRRQLEAFNRMNAAQKELFRLGAAQRLNDDILNASQTANIAARFLRPGAQQQIRTVFGRDAGDALVQRFRFSQVGSRTRAQFLTGSRTAPLLEDLSEQAGQARIAVDALTGNIPGLAANALERLRRGVSERNADAIIGVLLETNPTVQRRILARLVEAGESLENVARLQQAAAIGTGAALGTGAGRLLGSERIQ